MTDDRRLVTAIREAYDDGATGWATGPSPVYRQLARALIAAAPSSLAGQPVLDLGTGTGVASEVLLEVGADPVGIDLALEMLRHRRRERPPGVVGDAQALPFRAEAFEAVVAAFCLNHLPDPVGGLRECRRVTRPGGAVLASTFPGDADHPAKSIVEATLETLGYQRPPWYRTFKERIAELTGDAAALAEAAAHAGLTDLEVDRHEVEDGLDQPELAAAWRLNMPHTIGFVAALSPDARAALRSRVVAALSDHRLPSTVPVLLLRAHAPR